MIYSISLQGLTSKLKSSPSCWFHCVELSNCPLWIQLVSAQLLTFLMVHGKSCKQKQGYHHYLYIKMWSCLVKASDIRQAKSLFKINLSKNWLLCTIFKCNITWMQSVSSYEQRTKQKCWRIKYYFCKLTFVLIRAVFYLSSLPGHQGIYSCQILQRDHYVLLLERK